MAKAAAPKTSAESLFKELETMQGKAQSAIDGLMEEKQAAKKVYEEKAAALDQQIMRLDEVYKAASGRYYIGVERKGKEEGTKGTRTRRTKEDMAAEAKAIVAFVASKGKDGVKGAEIKARFPKSGPSIVKFVEDNGGGRLTTSGQKASTKYYVEN